jgi:endonuclease-8
MPEGDTVHRVTRILARELSGRVLDALELHDRGPVPELSGRRIEAVEARGKHMLVHIEGGWTLRVHLGMHGRWRRQHALEARPRQTTVVITSGRTTYACARAYRAELLRTRHLRAHARLARLGPDLLADPPAIGDAVARARLPANAEREIADLLLDQRVAAGIGNIYKSEVLFERRIHPRTLVRALGPESLRALYAEAAHLLRLSLLTRGRSPAPVRRRSRPTGTRLWVYGRAGKPCLDCGTPVVWFRQGDMGRSTWFCPGCQPLDPVPVAASGGTAAGVVEPGGFR